MERTLASSSNFEDGFMESESEKKFEDKKYSRKVNRIRKMYLYAFCALLLSLATGLSTGYSAPATYDMVTRHNSVIKPNPKEVMWIGSIIALGFIAGSLFSGPLADRIGRKDALICSIIPSGCGFLVICYAESVPVVIFGRFLSGVSCGIVTVVVAMYCVEISTAEVRGNLGSAPQGFLVIGNLLSVTVGAFITWKYLALHGVIVCLFAVTCFFIVPETPRWFLMKHDLKNAISAMNKIQGGFLDAEKECEAIYKDLQNQPKGHITLEELKNPAVFKPALIGIAIFFFQEFSGINAVFLYSSSIFESSEHSIDPKLGTIILATVQVFATAISNLLVDKLGRKILLVMSGSVLALGCAILGMYYYMASININFMDMYGWIPLMCLTLCVIGYSLGYGPIPGLLAAEMLPIRARGTVLAVVQFIGGIFIFTVTNTFTDMENLMYNYGTFWFYSSMSVIGVIFVILFVPETKGKKLEAIEDFFVKKHVRRDINISVLT